MVNGHRQCRESLNVEFVWEECIGKVGGKGETNREGRKSGRKEEGERQRKAGRDRLGVGGASLIRALHLQTVP